MQRTPTEIRLTQAGLGVIGVYWLGGMFAAKPYSWPLLLGPGPLWSPYVLYLAWRLRSRQAHLFGLVRFVWLLTLPWSLAVLGSGVLHHGGIHPLALLPTLVSGSAIASGAPDRAHLQSRTKDGHLLRASLVELFWGFGRWALLFLGVLAFAAPRMNEAFGLIIQVGGGFHVRHLTALASVLFLPAGFAVALGASLRRSGDRRGTMVGILVWAALTLSLHVLLLVGFAGTSGALAVGLVWDATMLGFFVRVFRHRDSIARDARARAMAPATF